MLKTNYIEQKSMKSKQKLNNLYRCISKEPRTHGRQQINSYNILRSSISYSFLVRKYVISLVLHCHKLPSQSGRELEFIPQIRGIICKSYSASHVFKLNIWVTYTNNNLITGSLKCFFITFFQRYDFLESPCFQKSD